MYRLISQPELQGCHSDKGRVGDRLNNRFNNHHFMLQWLYHGTECKNKTVACCYTQFATF